MSTRMLIESAVLVNACEQCIAFVFITRDRIVKDVQHITIEVIDQIIECITRKKIILND